MNFYQECLNGELELQEVNGSQIEHWAGSTDDILHPSLTVNGEQVTYGVGYVRQAWIC